MSAPPRLRQRSTSRRCMTTLSMSRRTSSMRRSAITRFSQSWDCHCCLESARAEVVFAKKAASISVYLESLVSNELKKGARVRHPSVAEWGLGLVLEDSDGDHVRVFFTEVGEKKMSLKVVQPIVVTGEAAQSTILDNLKIEGGRVAVKYKSLSASI